MERIVEIDENSVILNDLERFKFGFLEFMLGFVYDVGNCEEGLFDGLLIIVFQGGSNFLE